MASISSKINANPLLSKYVTASVVYKGTAPAYKYTLTLPDSFTSGAAATYITSTLQPYYPSGTYGTITGLSSGYRVVGALMTGTAGALSGVTQTVTSGTLASASDVVAGDYIVSVTTPVVAKVISVASDTTFLSSSTTALTSTSTLNLFKWRALPL
jgi:hypothetical protein